MTAANVQTWYLTSILRDHQMTLGLLYAYGSTPEIKMHPACGRASQPQRQIITYVTSVM